MYAPKKRLKMDFIVRLYVGTWTPRTAAELVSYRKQHILETTWKQKLEKMRNALMTARFCFLCGSAFSFFFFFLKKHWTRQIKRCSAAGNSADPLQKRIKKSSAESTDWHIPLQSIYAVCHFAKATNMERDGCFQATGQQAPAACIQVEPLLANHKLQFPL